VDRGVRLDDLAGRVLAGQVPGKRGGGERVEQRRTDRSLPICWAVFTVAEATPASCGSTPEVPAFIAGAMMAPMPIPKSISGPRICAA
jgi:hypothetical protein